MDVSVILVSYNTKDLTRNCLNSIYEKTKDIEFEVFVVDNNSHDGSPEMVEQEFPQVKLIRNLDNKGFGAANNIAIKQSNAKYIFCLNTDTLLLDNSIKTFFDYMEKEENKKVGACGGYLSNNNEYCISYGSLPSFKEILCRFFKLNYICYPDNSIEKSFPVGYISGADIFLRKNLLEEIGSFDEDFFMYYEDTDLCARILKNNYNNIILPYVNIIHLESKSTKNNNKKITMMKKSEKLYHKKHSNILLQLLINVHTYLKYKIK